MQLNRFTDYGLRVLIYLCSQRLSRLGWSVFARGISLREESRSLNLASIVDKPESDMIPIDCAAVVASYKLEDLRIGALAPIRLPGEQAGE